MLTPLTRDDPQRIGPYQLTNRIGAGGMGVVYLGFTDDGQAAAVKVPSATLVDAPEFRARFRQEVTAAGRVRSASVAAVLDADPTGSQPWMATEYVEGRSLSEAVQTRGPFDEHLVTAVAVGLADALVAIHAAGVVHRDLKPANVLLAFDGPRVIDFGVARDDHNPTQTQAGSLIGTLAWMAPEQLRGERAGPAADIFAWGACVAFAAAGRPAFRGDTAQVVALQILTGEPDLERLPPSLTSQVRAALRKEPAERPTATEILAHLLGRPPGAPADPAATGQVMREWWNLPGTPPGGGPARRPGTPTARPGQVPASSWPPQPPPAAARAPAPGRPAPGQVHRTLPDHRPPSAGQPYPARYSPGHRSPGHADPGYADPGYADPGYPSSGYRQPGPPQGGYRNPGPPGRPGGGRRQGAVPVAVAVVLGLLLVAGGVTATVLLNAGQDPGTGVQTAAPSPEGTPSTAPPTGTVGPGTPGAPGTDPSSGSSPTPSAPVTPSSGQQSGGTGSATAPAQVLTANDAAQIIRREGYTPDMGTYDPQRMLSLVRGSREEGGRHQELAFVFADGAYQGTDTRAPSTSIAVDHSGPVDATVTYRTYDAGGTAPTGEVTVRFRWNGANFVALDTIPTEDPTVANHR
ncbi:serine/threonine protein kinase [Parafrankia colletiae]|uniref:non-specific serine/threonine protein kinase n=1 Tax=Parafrankia colletiae TaxID=573497 RepID=A0A1S1RKF8_9ACTN|nr:protein kinase [Parafrankia colletiae]OHV46670.1 serine/threonine protein kinase [Parafrankia colletiae]